MRFCSECGSGLDLAKKCLKCGFAQGKPMPKGPPLAALLIPLIPGIFGMLVWAYHEYELHQSVASINSSFDKVQAAIDKASAPQPTRT